MGQQGHPTEYRGCSRSTETNVLSRKPLPRSKTKAGALIFQVCPPGTSKRQGDFAQAGHARCLLTAGRRLAFVGWDSQQYLDTDGLAGSHGGLEYPTAKRQPSGSIHLRG